MLVSVFLTTTFLGFLSYLIWWYYKRLTYWSDLGVPCEKPHWLWGSCKGLQSTYSFSELCFNYYKKFKGKAPFAGFYFATKPTIFLMDPTLIKHILIKDFWNFTDHGFYHNEEDDPLTGQLFLLDGIKWRNMRNKLSPTFSSGKMKNMFPIITNIAEEFITIMDSELKEHENIIELRDLVARFTTDVTGTCVFGIQCNSLKEPNCEFRVMGKRAVKEQRHGLFIMVLIQNFPNMARKLHIKQTPDDIEKFYINLVKETVEYRENNNIQRNDLMNTLIDLKNKKLIPSEHGDELANLTLNEIAAQAFVFFNAGFEITSTTISLALYELARNPKVQETARKEIDEVLEKYEQKFTYDSMREMKYLNQIMAETLRLYTVFPTINRIALSDFILPGYTNFVIKKGMNILIPACAIHRDPEYYTNPDTFNPDNFADDLVAQRNSCLWLPFGEGPRNCIGMRFAKMQVFISLVVLLRNFRFSTCDQTQIPLTFDKTSFTLLPEKGIFLKVDKL